MKKVLVCLFSLVMALAMLTGNVLTVFAENAEPPPSSVSAEETAPPPEGEPPAGEIPPPADSSSVPPDSSSSEDSLPPAGAPPTSEPPDSSSAPSGSQPAEEPVIVPVDELPAEETERFLPLEVTAFTAETEAELGQDVTLHVGLNRDDVAVEYQWQMDVPPEETELLFDYSSYADTSYFFPYEDITETELLDMNPDATWPGVEMYLEEVDAAEEAGEDPAAVHIENGTPNLIVEEALAAGDTGVLGADMPNWQDVEGAETSDYLFTVDEENAEAAYRCVITIVDEAYLAEAAANAEDAYGDFAAQLTEEGALPAEGEAAQENEATPAASDEAQMPEESGAPSEDETTPEEDFVPAVETELVTDTASLLLPQPMMLMAAPGMGSVRQDGPWIVGLAEGMEYITADTLAVHPEANSADNKLWTYIGTEGFDPTQINRVRPDGTSYLQAPLTTNGKLAVLSAWYGKTVHFRYNGTDISQAISISIPAYTGIDYSTGIKTLYKDAVSVLNVFVPETTRNFYDSVLGGMRGTHSALAGANGSYIITTNYPLTPNKYPTGTHDNYSGRSFNENANSYLRDAEGNYRYDSVMVGTCVGEEPDLSGAAAVALRDYIAEGYGFITGHDMMYAYGGVTDANYEPNPNSTVTPYYMFNTKTDGHWNMNWLMGVNKLYTEANPYDAPSMVLCAGDYRDKSTLYGEMDGYLRSTLRVNTYMNPTTSVISRTPTNYPYNTSNSGVAFHQGAEIYSHSTHSNQQIAYGTVWMDFASNSLALYGSGMLVEDRRADGSYGTNNFYLTTNGNLAMNQIGHIIYPLENGGATVFADEARILANTVMYVSQRQQCQVCQSGQGGSTGAHFVHRIYTADELAKIGNPNYWYTHPADGCYMLAANITLPNNWQPIRNFTGHFHADNYGSASGQLSNYRVTLGANNLPVFATDSATWGLGTNPAVGVPTIAAGNGARTTSVARVSGQLHLLLGGKAQDWANCIVVIEDTNGNEYWARTNNEGKYVVSNLPCTGVMDARVYKTGTYSANMEAYGIPQNGSMRVNVQADFWDTNDTTAIYLRGLTAIPIKDVALYDEQTATFTGGVQHDEKVTNVTWEVMLPGASTWTPIASSGLNYTIVAPVFHTDGGAARTEASVKINNACVQDSGLRVRAIFRTPGGEQVDTDTVGSPGKTGKLTVNYWPMRITAPKDATVWVDGTATFTSSVETKGGIGSGLAVTWQIRRWSTDAWTDVTAYGPMNTAVTTTKVVNSAASNTGNADYPVKTTSTLTITTTPDALTGMYVRAVYTYTGAHTTHGGNTKASADQAAKLTVVQPKLGVEWIPGQESRIGMTFENPLWCRSGSEYSTDLAHYEADVYYQPGAAETSLGTPTTDVIWQYKRVTDALPLTWNQAAANTIATSLGVTAPTVTITTGAPVKQADGRYKIHTQMKITNVHWKFYSDACFISFMATAQTHYKTSPYTTVAAANYRIPLVVDFVVGVKWNTGVRTDNTTYSTWKYPSATVDSAGGVKTLVLEFDRTSVPTFDGRDRLVASGVPTGMRAEFVGMEYIMFVADTAVAASVVETYLRTKVSVNVYDTSATVKPKIRVYINATRNLGTSQAGFAASTFMEGFESLGEISLMYANTVTVRWASNYFYVGGSAVAHANYTDAAYYQWQLNTGGGWSSISGATRPTYVIANLTSGMTGYKLRLLYGDSAATAVASNELALAFGFTNATVAGESSATGSGQLYNVIGNSIGIPAVYAPYVTQVTFSYTVTVDKDPIGDIFYSVYDQSNRELFGGQLWGTTTSGTRTVTLTTGTGLTAVKARVYNNARAVAYVATVRVYNVRVTGVGSYALESGPVFRRGVHEAWDITTVWHKASPNVVAVTTAVGKVYDGTEVMATVTLRDKAGILTDAELTLIKNRGTVVYSSGITLAGSATSGSKCIDAGTYTAKFVPATADAASFSANTTAEINGRTATFVVSKRPLYLYSYNNNREYDQTGDATIINVQFKALVASPASGIVAADAGKVSVTPTTFPGVYDNERVDQTNGSQWKILRLDSTPISLTGTRAQNYEIAGEDYSGAIKPRGLDIHSLYLEDPDVPRNYKGYDGYLNATIRNIEIDNIVSGDAVWVNADSYPGEYSWAKSYEKLNSDGTTLPMPERYRHLARLDENGNEVPNIITRTNKQTNPMLLVNNELGNYYIRSENYSGAIFRVQIDISIKDKSTPYGQAFAPVFTSAPVYSASITGQQGYDLVVNGLCGSDTLTIDGSKSWFDFSTTITSTTPVGNYPVTYAGLNEANYPVLSNYLVNQRDGYLQVTPAELVVTVNGGYEKLFGDDNPPFDVIYEGFLNGDTPETALTGTLEYYTLCQKDSPVLHRADGELNSYSITASGLECKENENGAYNYTIRYVSGSIKVLPREVRIIAIAQEKTYGDPDPTPRYTVESAEDLGDVDFVLTREPGENVGEYQYVLDESQLDDLFCGNHTIVFVPANLTINPATLIITANPASRPTLTEDPPFSVLYDGFVNGDDENDLEGELEFTTNAQFDSPAGTYSIVPSGRTSSNYTIQYQEGTLTIFDLISIMKSANRQTVGQGETIEYSISVRNRGVQTLEDVLVSDVMSLLNGAVSRDPAGNLVVAASDEYIYNEDGTFRIPSMEGGQIIVIRYFYTTAQMDEGGFVITNTATATVTRQGYTQSWSSTAQVPVNVNRNIGIDKNANRESVKAGETVQYSITVTNNGNIPLAGITVEDVMTKHTSTITVVPSPDYSVWKDPNRERRVFTLRTLQPGETVIIEYSLIVSTSDANQRLMFHNVATASLPADGVLPAVSVRDEVRVTAEFAAPPGILSMIKTADVVWANFGNTITYTVVITNNTSNTVRNISLQDKMNPQRGSIVVVSGNEYWSGGRKFDIPSLAPGASVTLVYTYTVDEQDTRGSDQITNRIEWNNGGVYSNFVYVDIP